MRTAPDDEPETSVVTARKMTDMADSEAMVRWETAAMRESVSRRSVPPSPAFAGRRITGNWLTLREAHDATAIPVETLRKWARRKHVPSRVVETEFGTRRIVDMDAVTSRARQLGRAISAPEHHESEIPLASPAAEVPSRVPDPVQESEQAQDSEPGTMIVPIAAWDRVLMQLGNLHRAGQELAEARERAAKAETEAAFLRERLADLRAQLQPPDPAPPAGSREMGRWRAAMNAFRRP